MASADSMPETEQYIPEYSTTTYSEGQAESAADSSAPQEDENILQSEATKTETATGDAEEPEAMDETESGKPSDEKDDNDENKEGKIKKEEEPVEVAHWCRPCRVRILPATEAAWVEHAIQEIHKTKVEEMKTRIAEVKKAAGKTDTKDVTDEDIDQVTVGRWCKLCNWFVPQHIGWNAHNRDRRHKKNAVKKGTGDGTDDSVKPGANKRYMCVHCSTKYTYPELGLHLARDHPHTILKPHQVNTSREKGSNSNSTGMFKLAQRLISARKEPMVGLDFITEYQRKNQKPFFICDLCRSMITGASSLVFHLATLKHKNTYWRCVANEQYQEFKEKGLKGVQMASTIQKRVTLLQKKHGRGKMNVLKGAKGYPLSFGSQSPASIDDGPGRQYQKRSREWNEFDDGYMSSKRAYYDRGPEMSPWLEPNPMMGRSQEQFFPNMSSQFQYSEPEAYCPNDSMDMPTLEKFKIIEKLFDFPISTKSQETIAGNIVNTLKKKLLQYKIQNIPDSVQDVLAKSLFGDDEGQSMDIIQGIESGYREYPSGPSGMNWGGRRERSYSPDRSMSMASRDAYDRNMQANQSGFRQRFRNGSYRPMTNQNGRGSKFYRSGYEKSNMNRGGYRGRNRRPFD